MKYSRIIVLRHDNSTSPRGRLYKANTFDRGLSRKEFDDQVYIMRREILKDIHDGRIDVNIKNFDKNRIFVSESGNICYLDIDNENDFTSGKMFTLFEFGYCDIGCIDSTIMTMYNGEFVASRILEDSSWILVDKRKIAFAKIKCTLPIENIEDIIDEIDRRIDKYFNPSKPAKMRMVAKFEILKDNGTGIFDTIDFDRKSDVVTPGGFNFCINNQDISFDFPTFSCLRVDNYFKYESGYGSVYHDFTLDSCYDEEYERLGIDLSDITAEFLASASRINEFYIDYSSYFHDKEFGIGENDAHSNYRIKILSIDFIDINGDEAKSYSVKPEAIQAFNNGN